MQSAQGTATYQLVESVENKSDWVMKSLEIDWL